MKTAADAYEKKEDRHMPDDVVVRHCAPTLAGLKTGNLFTTSYETEEQLDSDITRLNAVLGAKGLRVRKLRADHGRALIYVYRPGLLRSDLGSEDARRILRRFGYGEVGTENCIARLMERIGENDGFPHEIGLFLGYPPEDVQGFIDYGGRACKSCGYWKVYGDVQEAEKQFRRFTRCTGVYMKCLRMGTPFEKLAVRKAV